MIADHMGLGVSGRTQFAPLFILGLTRPGPARLRWISIFHGQTSPTDGPACAHLLSGPLILAAEVLGKRLAS